MILDQNIKKLFKIFCLKDYKPNNNDNSNDRKQQSIDVKSPKNYTVKINSCLQKNVHDNCYFNC